MTTPALTEWNIAYDTRIGSLCPVGDPTVEQRDMAEREASEHVKELRELDERKPLPLSPPLPADANRVSPL